LRSAPTIDAQLGAIEDATPPGLTLAAVDGAVCLDLRLRWSREVYRRPGARKAAVLGPGAINRRLSRLRRVLAFARDHWGIDTKRVVWRDIFLPEAEPKDRARPRDDLRRLWHAAESAHLRRFITLAQLTGLRSGPLLSLARENVDLRNRRIVIHSKGRGPQGKLTTVPLDDVAYRYLRRVMPDDDRPLVRYRGHGVRSIKVAWKAAVRRAGLPETVTPHSLRHSTLQMLYDATGDLELVRQAAHHADLRTTSRYARAREERVREGMARMRRRRG
jgi:integrase